MQGSLDEATDQWGIKVERVEIKDVKLPQQMQRAMAAEAEASRDARAKVGGAGPVCLKLKHLHKVQRTICPKKVIKYYNQIQGQHQLLLIPTSASDWLKEVQGGHLDPISANHNQ